MEKKKGARTKLKEYFYQHVGEVVDSDTLREVAGISEWARRVRELRNEEGMDIQTHNDRSDLRPGQYVLASTKLLPAFERTISKEVRALVLDRDGYTCQMCGVAAGEFHPYYPNRKVRLHIGHIIDKSQGGTDDPSNLRALCSVCNEGASDITLERPTYLKLLTQIRRAPRNDQTMILKWLVNKFPDQTEELLKDRG